VKYELCEGGGLFYEPQPSAELLALCIGSHRKRERDRGREDEGEGERWREVSDTGKKGFYSYDVFQ